jgi:hypothetical protein
MQRKLAFPHAQRVLATMLVAAVTCAGRGARAEASPVEAPRPEPPHAEPPHVEAPRAEAPRPAGEQPPRPPIVLVLDPCAAVDAQEVRRLVPIEMGAPLAADAPGTTRVFVGCVVGSPQLVRLEVRDPANGRHVDRVITLVGESKTDQARLVAIVAVELVAASRTELREAPPAAAPVPDARLAVTAAAAPPPEEPRAHWRVLAEGSLRHIAGLPRVLPGGGLSFSRAWSSGLALAADLLFEGAGEPTALGDVDTFLASGSLVGAWRGERGRLAWESGVGARVGYARLAGQPPSGAHQLVVLGELSAPWMGPLVTARASAAVGHHVLLSLGGELGYVTSAVAGHIMDRPDVAVSGAWWNVVLGVGYGR